MKTLSKYEMQDVQGGIVGTLIKAAVKGVKWATKKVAKNKKATIATASTEVLTSPDSQ